MALLAAAGGGAAAVLGILTPICPGPVASRRCAPPSLPHRWHPQVDCPCLRRLLRTASQEGPAVRKGFPALRAGAAALGPTGGSEWPSSRAEGAASGGRGRLPLKREAPLARDSFSEYLDGCSCSRWRVSKKRFTSCWMKPRSACPLPPRPLRQSPPCLCVCVKGVCVCVCYNAPG